MKSTSFSLLTSDGDTHRISVNLFWEQYCHCKEAHPEEEPIKSALEHILEMRLSNGIPPDVFTGCSQIVTFYAARAKAGIAMRAMKKFKERYPDPAVRTRLQETAYRNWYNQQLMDAEPVGPMQ